MLRCAKSEAARVSATCMPAHFLLLRVSASHFHWNNHVPQNLSSVIFLICQMSVGLFYSHLRDFSLCGMTSRLALDQNPKPLLCLLLYTSSQYCYVWVFASSKWHFYKGNKSVLFVHNPWSLMPSSNYIWSNTWRCLTANKADFSMLVISCQIGC